MKKIKFINNNFGFIQLISGLIIMSLFELTDPLYLVGWILSIIVFQLDAIRNKEVARTQIEKLIINEIEK